jgi:hypothetical protein
VVIVAIGAAARLVAGASTLPPLGSGLGLSNLRLYMGALPDSSGLALPALVVASAVVALVLARRASLEGPQLLGVGAAVLMIALWLAPRAAPDDVVAPIALLAIAVTHERRDSFDTAEVAL